jgi:hypothetical protein
MGGNKMNEQETLIKEPPLKEVPPEIIKALEKGHVKAKFYHVNGEVTTERLFKKDWMICVFKKGSSRKGYRLDDYQLSYLKKIEIIPEKKIDLSVTWRKKMLEVKTRLEISGLWPDMLKDINTALEVGFENLNKAYRIMEQRREDKDYSENQSLNTGELKAFEPRLVDEYEPGKWAQNTSIMWYMARVPKVKKMNFGEGSVNEYHLNIIKEGLASKSKTNTEGRTSYDVSFEYDGINKAWYSEEYHNCGNGHYYLALDTTHALFYEDD